MHMPLLPQRSNPVLHDRAKLPFAVYTVGTEHQQPIARLRGFSAHQLFLTFAGSGRFRTLDGSGWRTLSAGTLLTLPADCPYECVPLGDEPWRIGYVSFAAEASEGWTEWIVGGRPRFATIREPELALAGLERIWDVCGPAFDPWAACERLFAYCLLLKRQTDPEAAPPREAATADDGGAYAERILDAAIRYMHDHLDRPVAIAELAGCVGYSQRQLTRLFRRKLKTTPLRYLQDYRLRTGDSLLKDNLQLTIAQTAASVGMSPEYFSKMYKKRFGRLPSEARVD
ncbi:AraC family transcriptional regulator [Paenibacillus antri]|uniref:AraC family transcriptional regulator n=1 Tax=Paenibacillus antri TaxID=2582848 RepID=A0A5R9G2N1_9BACL|nr:AraC family transcriptional regulator [Paenibacillus antri]TLS49279.1 AraC family transcriptional regulator [Paenibacillus antri]